ncbi:MAG: diphosphomevalonate decarboxylase [bacterium]
MHKATAGAGSNIAFVKYWGVRHGGADPMVPLNPSISMTLEEVRTTTTVAFEPGAAGDLFTLNGSPATADELRRVGRVLDAVRRRAGMRRFARVVSSNNFPTAAGIASSASGFAALALAAARAAGLPYEPPDLVEPALLGSGSACRSLYGGYVLWQPPAAGRRESTVREVAPREHWPLADLVVIVSRKEKRVKSSEGHLLARTSPFLRARLAQVEGRIARVERAIFERDLRALGEVMEADALSMHAVMMTSTPALLYWQPATVAVIEKVQALRAADALACYFTIDAGPNVHVITAPETARAAEQEIRRIEGVEQILSCSTGEAPRLLQEHLF